MYEVIGEGNWAWLVAKAKLDRGAKFICLLLHLRLPQSGKVDLGTKNEWLAELAEESGLTPAQVEGRIEKAQKAGWLTVVRYRDESGEYRGCSLSISKPRVGPVQNVQTFMASRDSFVADIAKALETDTRERGLQPTLLG